MHGASSMLYDCNVIYHYTPCPLLKNMYPGYNYSPFMNYRNKRIEEEKCISICGASLNVGTMRHIQIKVGVKVHIDIILIVQINMNNIIKPVADPGGGGQQALRKFNTLINIFWVVTLSSPCLQWQSIFSYLSEQDHTYYIVIPLQEYVIIWSLLLFF